MKRLFLCVVLASILLFVAITASVAAVSVIPVGDWKSQPIEFGVNDLRDTLFQKISISKKVDIFVACLGDENNAAFRSAAKHLPDKPESFVIKRVGDDIAILGSDQNGAMYGCFELAEMLERHDKRALDILDKPVVQSPKVEFRAINPFVTLPYKEEYDEWYFLQDDYWEGYLNQLARARFNWIDLHGMYDIKKTNFPNIYPYFIISEKYPDIGVSPEMAQRNLAMLKKIMRMAHQRGIKVGLMSYSTDLHGPFLRKHDYQVDEQMLAEYTREVVAKLIQSCPDLDMIGFRIGESGRSGDFFRTSYIPAIKDAGRDIDLYTRSWLTEKPPIVEIGNEFPGRFFVEIKFNGEQFGPPYIVAGQRTLVHHSYFFQDYYSYPQNYKIIYQLRSNGSHRVFYWGSPIIAARANECSLLGGAIGLCVEPMDSYYPKYDYRHADDSPNKWFKWQYERDWYYYQVWGRTAYNPTLAYKDDVWISMFDKRFGAEVGESLYKAMNWASKIIPDALNARLIHPDHRIHAPELEIGGNVMHWADGLPFDLQNIQSPEEYAWRVVHDKPSARKTPFDMVEYLQQEANMTRVYVQQANAYAKKRDAEFKDLLTELTALSYLADFIGHKLAASTHYAIMREVNDVDGAGFGGMERALFHVEQSHRAWQALAAIGDEHYKPFVDTLRMYTEEYTWTSQIKHLDEDYQALKDLREKIENSNEERKRVSFVDRSDAEGPEITDISHEVIDINESEKRLLVRVKITDAAGVGSVYLKTKPLPSETLWSLTPMKKKGDYYEAEVSVLSEGLMWCIEALDKDNNGTLWPNFRKETPYKVVMSWDAPMPWDDPATALKKFESMSFDSSDYSALVVGMSASDLNAASLEVKSKIIKLVKGGLNLVFLMQDNQKHWDPSWLGGDIKVTEKSSYTIDFSGKHPILDNIPAHINRRWSVANGLDGGDETWVHLSEPKALAVRKLGDGEIILMQSDVRHWIFLPIVEQYLRGVMDYARGGSDKPLLVLDPGERSITLFDYINVPYVRLGELTYTR